MNDVNGLDDPFRNLKVGQTVTARIIAKAKQSDKKSYQWDLSLKPKLLTDSFEMEDKLMAKDVDFSSGECITGYVYKVDSEWIWLIVSRDVRAQLFILDSAHDPSDLEGFQKRFHVGKGVSGHILSINNEKKLIRLVLSPSFAVSYGNVGGKDDLKTNDLNDVTSHVHEGDVVGGRISKILAGIGGLLVQIGPQLYGRVLHFMELRDS